MKVLYIGHYREGTGWGHAAIDYILSLDAVGVDVVCRPIKLNNKNPELPQRIYELENKSLSGCTHCIQHVLPHLLDYNGRFEKNIALYATETSDFYWSSWSQKINTMDEAWVINSGMIKASKDSGIDIPIKVVPHAANMEKFERSHQGLEIELLDGNFVFYFIGELIRRKNLVALLKAFHLEFDRNEPVSLLLKTYKSGLDEDEAFKHTVEICNQVKTNLKLYKDMDDYNREVIVTEHLTDDQMCSLHYAGDCFVMPSFGEAWCIPAFEAMGFGKTPICSNNGGMKDFISEDLLVEGNMEPVFGMTDTFEDLCTGREQWFNIDVRKLQKTMRTIYNLHNSDDESYKELQRLGLKSAYNFSYEVVGILMKGLLNAN